MGCGELRVRAAKAGEREAEALTYEQAYGTESRRAGRLQRPVQQGAGPGKA